MAEWGTLTLPASLWAEAKRRAAVMAPLAAAAVVPAAAARAANEALGLSEHTVYALVRRYRHSSSLLASLAPPPPLGGRGKTRLPHPAEQIITEAIRDEYLTRQNWRRSVAEFGPPPARASF